METDFLTYSEAAELLNIKKYLLAKKVKNNEIPFIRYSKNSIRFDRRDLLEWVEKNKRGENLKEID